MMIVRVKTFLLIHLSISMTLAYKMNKRKNKSLDSKALKDLRVLKRNKLND